MSGDTAERENDLAEKGIVQEEQRQDNAAGLACDLDAIPAEQRADHTTKASYLFRHCVQAIEELAQGYAFRFAADAYPLVMAFVANERLCCPFLTFSVDVLPHQGPIWLRMTGAAGAKELLSAELNFAEAPPREAASIQ